MAAAVGRALLQDTSLGGLYLVGTSISAPLILPSPTAAPGDYLAAALRAEVVAADGTCQLASAGGVHVSTRFALAHGAAEAALTVAATTERLAAECREPLATEYAYRQLEAAGLQYGPAFRRVRGIKRSCDAAAASVRQPAAQLPAEFILNPAVLDSCLQLGGMVPAQAQGSSSSSAGSTYVPASLAAMHIGSNSLGGASAIALARRPTGVLDSEAAVLRNHAILTPAGCFLCQLERLESRATRSRGAAMGSAAAALQQQQDMLYEVGWAAADPASAVALAAQPAASSQLALALATAGSSSVALTATSISAVQAVLAAGAGSLQLQTLGQHATPALPGASSAGEPGQLWGLLRTVAAEAQTLAVSGADADALAPSARRAAQLMLGSAADAAQPFDGYGTAAAAGSRFLPHMLPSLASSTLPPFQLLPQPRGALQNLAPAPVNADAPLAPGQVLVAVKAVGINFRWGDSWENVLLSAYPDFTAVFQCCADNM